MMYIFSRNSPVVVQLGKYDPIQRRSAAILP